VTIFRDARFHVRRALFVIFVLGFITFAPGQGRTSAQAAIAFVQANFAAPQTAQATVTVPYTAAQTSGNTNVVVVGWNDTTAQVTGISDTRGNVYVRAVGPTVLAGLGTQSIYYAAGISSASAGANAVTVTLNVPAVFVDVRVAEYGGIDTTTPLDVIAAATGNGTTSSSGSVTTTNPNDLLVGANLVAQGTKAAGSGYTKRIITSPDGDILEDRIVSATGSNAATASLTGGAWIMQMIALRAAGSPTDTQPPSTPSNLVANAVSNAQVTLMWTASTDNIGVTGYRVERCLNGGCSNFTQIGTTTTASYADTTVAGSSTYNYRVRANDAAGNLGAYSNVATATTAAAPDTQAPTAPGGLTATANSSTQVGLAWTASTDNVGVANYLVERCAGTSCTNFVQVGTSPAPALVDGGLTASTAYRYRVRATDAAGNLSAYSNIASATTPAVPDTQPPTAPSNLAASGISSTEIDLTWVAATDNVGVTSYLIEQCQGTGCSSFVQIAASTTTSFTNTGLSSGSSYSYRVRATDAAGNLGSYSNIGTASTSQPDTQAPSAPSALVAAAVSSSQINLAWNAATDNVGVTSYLVERCQGTNCTTFAQVGTSAMTPFSNTGLSGGVAYSYRVRATDAAGNQGPYSNTATATTTAAAVITFVQVSAATPQTSQTTVTIPFTKAQGAGNLNVIAVGWNSSSGSVVSVTDTRGNTYLPAVGPTVSPGFATQSIYFAANIGAAAAGANVVSVTFSQSVPFADIRIAEYSGLSPVDPVDVVATGQGSGTASTSTSVTTTSPDVLIVGANIVSSATTGAGASFTNRLITTPDADILEDRIVSATGNYNATAPILSGTWIMQMVAFRTGPAAPDTQPPSAPTALTATAPSGSTVNLSWTAATDNVGIAGYRIERCQNAGCSDFTEIAVPVGTNTTFGDTGLASNISYSYRVRATDAAGNLGPYSNVAVVTTPAPDVEPPSAPGVLTATAISGTQIDVSWGAATDNVGVAGYRLERCQGVGCSAFTKLGTTITGTSFSDTSLNINTSYSYIVRAQDAAGNLGPYSNVASATTLASNPQLVAAYSFDEGSGSTVADLSGHGNTGTVTSPSWTQTGKFGKALVFNGTTTLVTIPDTAALHLTTGMTLEAWVNPSAPAFGWRDVVYKGNDNYYLEASTGNPLPGIGITVGGTATEVTATTSLPVNTWTFLTATYDGTTVRFYLNGTQVGSAARSGSIVTSTNPLQIGGDSIYGQHFQGMIDEVRVYNVALTPAQIQTDMAIGVGTASPVVNLAPSSVNFGSQSVGTSSAVTPLTLINGGTLALNVTAVNITGVQAADFSQTNNCVGAIAPSASCTINVKFTPVNTGTRNAAVTITDNAPGNPHSVALTGVGLGFSITPQTVVVTPGRTQQFTVSGPGSGSVVWSVDGAPGGTAASGTITTAGLYSAPSAAGTHTVTVTATDGSKSASATTYVSVHAGVFTHHNDFARTGQNLNETVLSLSNVNAATFGKLASYTIDGIAHASPLYVANVNIPGVGVRNVVYVATEHDSLYAFDADGTGTSPLWKLSLLGTGVTTVPNSDVGECCDITPEIGITGTPVIDPATSTLYVVVKTKEGSSNYVQRLHALNLANGAEKFGGPVVIQASVPGTGTGSSGGTLAFNSLRENQRTALLLYNGVVYMGFGSHGDNQPYHGWLLGYNATTLQRVLTFVSTPNGEGGGIWQSGGGLAIDGAGNFYFATGDGTFDINSGGTDYGDTFLRFNPVGGVLDYFTPHDEGMIDSNNLDLDAGGMILLPDQPGAHPHLLVSAGKNGTIYVVDRDNMTHFHSTDQNVQTLVNIFPFGTPLPGNYSSPVYFNGAVYFAPVADVVQMFKLSNGRLTTSPTSTTPQSFAYPGAALAVSANGSDNGILWAVQKNGAAAGTLRAYDASNVAIEIYNSDQAGTRDTLDTAAKFSIPLVVNGKVFVASEGKLTVYGLLP
jgi:fibronectin type 3 domain-containing protein